MAKTDYLKLYLQDLLHNYSKECSIDLSDETMNTWFRHTLSEIDLLIHDRVRELVTAKNPQKERRCNLDEAEIRILRSYSPEQQNPKSLFKRLLLAEGHRR